MNILKSMAYTAVAAVGAYNLYLASDIQQVKSDLTFDTIELTASGNETGNENGGGSGGGGGASAVGGGSSYWTEGRTDMAGWDNHFAPYLPDGSKNPNYNNSCYSLQPENQPSYVSPTYNVYNTQNGNKTPLPKTGVDVRIGGRQGGIPGYNDGHWQINGPVCVSGHCENGHTYKSEVVSLICNYSGNECDGWRNETAHQETIYWDEVIR
ncbi:MAG: hypothetical protein J6Y82_06895 [Bacteroidales bacterium]|nr:hypothetical protein [Bacteroidales bacterium]